MSNDLQLQQRVIEELEFTPDVYAEHIGVGVRDGVVTLSGRVESFHEKCAAIDATRRVKGVKAVAQELMVRLPLDSCTADDEIAARAARMLDWDTLIPKGSVQVTVSSGVITLSGQVKHSFQREEAEEDVRKLSGVKNVINDIHLPPSQADARELHRWIRAALLRDVGDDRVEVNTHGGAVTLGGSVRTLAEKAAAEKAAWCAPGVNTVDNHIDVAGTH